MKLTLTKEKLKQIIKEELQGVLSEDDKKYDGRGMDKGFDTREEAEEARDSLPSYLSDLSIRQG
jgi:hypothetical protein